ARTGRRARRARPRRLGDAPSIRAIRGSVPWPEWFQPWPRFDLLRHPFFETFGQRITVFQEECRIDRQGRLHVLLGGGKVLLLSIRQEGVGILVDLPVRNVAHEAGLLLGLKSKFDEVDCLLLVRTSLQDHPTIAVEHMTGVPGYGKLRTLLLVG